MLARRGGKLRTVNTTPPADSLATDPTDAPDDEVVVLPWWHNPINLGVLAVAIALLAGALGWLIGNNNAVPDPNATDIGFLQDMRWHHDQAIEIAYTYMATPDTDGRLVTIAREIVLGQGIEIGQMAQLLRGWGEPEVNESDIAMSWMGTPTAIDRMPGLATEDDLITLANSSGTDADQRFVALMVAHHEGGIHMAEHAATHASQPEVRTMANQMIDAQQGEIDELRRLVAA